MGSGKPPHMISRGRSELRQWVAPGFFGCGAAAGFPWQRRTIQICCETHTRSMQEESGNALMSDRRDDVRYELALASRMLAHEGVLDAFGHVSLRHPGDPSRFLLPRSRSPQLIEPDDILEFTVEAEPVRAPTERLFAERVIHGCIYQARPDVMAVCHHHAAPVMPFCIAGVPIVPVFHLGAAGGAAIPFWDQQDEFGDTNLLVAK